LLKDYREKSATFQKYCQKIFEVANQSFKIAVRPVLDHYELVSGGGGVSDVTRGGRIHLIT